MTAAALAMVITILVVWIAARYRAYDLALPAAVAGVCFSVFFMVIWLANENMRDHAFYAKLIICRMSDKTGECP